MIVSCGGNINLARSHLFIPEGVLGCVLGITPFVGSILYGDRVKASQCLSNMAANTKVKVVCLLVLLLFDKLGSEIASTTFHERQKK